ncbi:MAG TPA: FtsQ-type POTRA domain-containing protein [Terracidiphilus sp.]
MPLEMPDLDDDDLPGPKSRRKSGRRGAWWKPSSTFGRIALGVGVVAILTGTAFAWYAARNFLERNNQFRIAGSANIQAVGLSQVSRAELLPVFGADMGRNVFFVPLAERRRQLEQIPWVEHATVMRLLPDQIRISIVERKPIAFVHHDGEVGLVDANGVLLDMPAAAMAQHHYSFPVVKGIRPGDTAAARRERMGVYQRLVGELDANGQHLSDQLSEVDLSDAEDARILMPEQGNDVVAHMGTDHFLDRFQRYKTHIAEWRQQYPQLSEVDLRYDQQVVLQMNHGGSNPPAALPATANAASAPAPVTAATKPAEKAPAKADTKPHVAAPQDATLQKASLQKPPVATHQKTAAPVKAKTSAPAKKTATKAETAKSAATAKPKHSDIAKAKPAQSKKSAKPAKKNAKAPAKAKSTHAAKETEVERKARLMRERREAAKHKAAHQKAAKSKAKPHATKGQGTASPKP